MKKKFLAVASAFGLPMLAMAEGNTPIQSITSAIGTQLTTWSSDITTFFTDNLTVIMGIVGIALAVGLLWVVFKLFKKATNKAS